LAVLAEDADAVLLRLTRGSGSWRGSFCVMGFCLDTLAGEQERPEMTPSLGIFCMGPPSNAFKKQ